MTKGLKFWSDQIKDANVKIKEYEETYGEWSQKLIIVDGDDMTNS